MSLITHKKLVSFLLACISLFSQLELRAPHTDETTNTENDDDDDDEFNTGRAMFARVDIPPNKTVIRVPKPLIITAEMGEATPIGQAILSAPSGILEESRDHIMVAIFLIYDQAQPQSFYGPYYQVLPESLDNVPIFWSRDDLQYLEGSDFIKRLEQFRAALQKEYDTIQTVYPKFVQQHNLTQYLYARMCVNSRSFSIVLNDNRETTVMVPQVDMLNHYYPRQANWAWNELEETFEIKSVNAIQAGTEVTTSYGNNWHYSFLMNYGFSIEHDRPDAFYPDDVMLQLSLQRQNDGSWYDTVKYEFWTRSEQPPEVTKGVWVSISNHVNVKQMFGLLRALHCSEAELQAVMNHNFPSPRHIQQPISIRNELASMKHLLEIATERLQRYPTTLEQDFADLTNLTAFPRFSNRRNAKIQVRGEKQVLVHFQTLATTAMDVLVAIDRELKGARDNGMQPTWETLIQGIKARKNAGLHYTIVNYCVDVLGTLRQKVLSRIKRR